MRKALLLIIGCLAICGSLPANALSQENEVQNVKVPASVTGRVLLDGKPLAGANVAVSLERQNDFKSRPTAQTKTDAEGRFKFNDLSPGKYKIVPQAPAFVLADEKKDFFNYRGKSIVLEAGETAEDIEFKLRRGAVITGSVTDVKGNPVIAEKVNLKRLTENGKTEQVESFRFSNQGKTDDLGVYRFYGLEAGQYLVSVGVDAKNDGMNRDAFFSNELSSRFFPLTFAPATSNRAEARIVAVKPGDEAENVDIKVGAKSSSFKITGRVVNAETGARLENIKASLTLTINEGQSRSSRNFGEVVKSDGNFVLTGILPGRYQVTLDLEDETEFFAQPVELEIIESDATNIEIKAAPGLSLSGTTVIENLSGAQSPIKLSELRLYASVRQSGEKRNFQHKVTQIKDDGSFRFNGLPPGKVQVSLLRFPPPKGLQLARIERGGAVIRAEDLQLADKQSIRDLQLILIYGNETLRGEIKIEGGAKPSNARIDIAAKPVGNGRLNAIWSRADARGKFLLENLVAEEYEVTATLSLPAAEKGKPGRNFSAKQKINIAGGVENQLNLIINLGEGASPQ